MNLKWCCDDPRLRGGRLASRRFMMRCDDGVTFWVVGIRRDNGVSDNALCARCKAVWKWYNMRDDNLAT